ncbi:hypothetical protein SHKM778_27870 [Streptomyces sp. KM77-8]|uniref:Uncharacterized protein n=1 Tax=Streptomyces haneummycinicus TaxID=3074435 RepID=A0AAT9HG66_9ACTN
MAVGGTRRMRLELTGHQDSDPEELDELTLLLRERLLELDVDAVETVRSGTSPTGPSPSKPSPWARSP